MPIYNKQTLGNQAKELEFVRDTLEKVYRLTDILKFIDIGIHPGIAIGRLQHDCLIPWSWHNSLKTSLTWKQ